MFEFAQKRTLFFRPANKIHAAASTALRERNRKFNIFPRQRCSGSVSDEIYFLMFVKRPLKCRFARVFSLTFSECFPGLVLHFRGPISANLTSLSLNCFAR